MPQRSDSSEVLNTGGVLLAVGASIAARTFCTTLLDKSATACKSAIPMRALSGGAYFFIDVCCLLFFGISSDTSKFYEIHFFLSIPSFCLSVR